MRTGTLPDKKEDPSGLQCSFTAQEKNVRFLEKQ